MQLLRKVVCFGTDPEVLKIIYKHIIRIILEQSCMVLDGALTTETEEHLKNTEIIVLRKFYQNNSYQEALLKVKLEDLQTQMTKWT